MNAPNGHDTGKVTSIEEARKRAAEKAKAERRAARAAGITGSRGWRDWVIGGLVVAMAIGYLASLFVGGPQLAGGGVQ